MSVKKSNLHKLILYVRIVSWTILFFLLSIPLYLGLTNILKNEVIFGFIGLTLSFTFYLFLAVRNESKFNNLLECAYFDSVTVVLLLTFIGISTALYFHPIYQKKIEEKKVIKHIEITSDLLDEHEKKSAILKREKDQLFDKLMKIKEELNPSIKNNFDKEQISKTLYEVEENINRTKNCLQNKNVFELNVLSLSAYPPKAFSDDRYDALRMKKRKILRKYKSTGKGLEEILDDCRRQKESAIFLLEILDFKKRARILEIKQTDIERQKVIIKKRILNLNRTNPIFKNFKESSLEVLAFLSEQKALEVKIINLESELKRLTNRYQWLEKEEPALLSSDAVSLEQKKYWEKNIKSRIREQSAKAYSISFQILKDKNIENYTVFTNWLKILLKKFPRELNLVNLIKEQERFLRVINKLKKSKSLLYNWESSYDDFLTYKENPLHVSSDFENVDKLPIEVVADKISKLGGKLDNYDYNRYYLTVYPVKAIMKSFNKQHNALDFSIKKAELIYSGELLDLKKKTVKLKSSFFKIKNEFENFASFKKKIEDYLNSYDSINEYYILSLKNIDEKLTTLRNRMFREKLLFADGYENLHSRFQKFRKETYELHCKVEDELHSAIKRLEEKKLALLKPPFRYLLDLRMNMESIHANRLTNEVKMISKYKANFNFKYRGLKHHSDKVSILIDAWIKLIDAFEGGWPGTNLKRKDGKTVTELKKECSTCVSKLNYLNRQQLEYVNKLDVMALNRLLGQYKNEINSIRLKIAITYFVTLMILALVFVSLKKVIQKVREHIQFKSYLKLSKEKAVNILLDITSDRSEKVSKRFHAIKILTQLGVCSKENYKMVEERVDEIGLRKNRIEKKVFSYLNEELINIERRLSRNI